MEVSGQPHHRANSPPVTTEYEPGWAPQPVWTFWRNYKTLACVRRCRREDCGLYSPCGHHVTAWTLRGAQQCRWGFHSSDICVRWYPDPNVSNELASPILQGCTDPVKALDSFETGPFSKGRVYQNNANLCFSHFYVGRPSHVFRLYGCCDLETWCSESSKCQPPPSPFHANSSSSLTVLIICRQLAYGPSCCCILRPLCPKPFSPLPASPSVLKQPIPNTTKCTRITLYILLTVHHVMILVKWPTCRTFLFYVFICIFNSLHVSSTSCSSSGETNCVNTNSGSCHSVSVAVSCAGRK
jgi:hypothetical protein